MTNRYFSKVASIPNGHTVVITKGADSGIKEGDEFLIVGLGDIIKDPDTGEILEQLELVRGKAKAIHVQQKVSTLESCDYTKETDVREIKKVSNNSSLSLISVFGGQDTVTESIKPGASVLKEFINVAIGDQVIKI